MNESCLERQLLDVCLLVPLYKMDVWHILIYLVDLFLYLNTLVILEVKHSVFVEKSINSRKGKEKTLIILLLSQKGTALLNILTLLC